MRTWSIVLSVLMIVAGMVAIGAPFVAGVALTTFVAWLLLLSGCLHLVYAWRAGRAGAIWEILLGIVYGGIGVFLIARPVAGLASLTLAIAAYLLIEGILEFALSIQLRRSGGSRWMMLDGVITLILAIMIWATWPSSAMWVVGTLIGISMLFSGITRLMLTMAVRRAVS
ncbi:MAG TPA: DUF308 domain-containing protein [Vicinamibacterales bacterium]